MHGSKCNTQRQKQQRAKTKTSVYIYAIDAIFVLRTTKYEKKKKILWLRRRRVHNNNICTRVSYARRFYPCSQSQKHHTFKLPTNGNGAVQNCCAHVASCAKFNLRVDSNECEMSKKKKKRKKVSHFQNAREIVRHSYI